LILDAITAVPPANMGLWFWSKRLFPCVHK
jgi:hypothetical protein